MNSIVIYASHFGNTKQIAEAIASGLRSRGSAQIFAVDEAPQMLPTGIDLVVVGGPTEAHGMTQPMARYFDRLAPDAMAGIAAAAFDTRLRWPRWLSGSAGTDISARLRRVGASMIVPAESFIIKGMANTGGGKTPELDDGELERATAWAGKLAEAFAASTAAAASR